MNDNSDILRRILANDKALSSSALDELRRKYPFFSLPDVLALRNNLHGLSQQERDEAIDRLAASLPSSADVQRLAEPDGTRFDNFYPHVDTPATPTTEQAIDTFLLNYGGSESENKTELSVLEKLIFNPVADYSQQLAREEEQSLPSDAPTGDSRTDRINRFILSNRPAPKPNPAPEQVPIEPATPTAPEHPAPKHKKTDITPPNDTLLSESLAKIFIKTHRYDRAYEIISHLSLAIPEKNAYFADQLRFLRKLMLNEQVKQQKSARQNK